MPARAGAHRRSTGPRPLWPRTGRSRRWVVRTTWAAVALAISASHDAAAGLGPAELGAAVSAGCLWAGLRTGLPTSLVGAVQTVVTLALTFLTVSLWTRHRPVGMALVALALAVGVQWWLQEDQSRRDLIAQESWRRAVLRRLDGLETRGADSPSSPEVVAAPLRSLPAIPWASVPAPRRHTVGRPVPAERRRGAHSARKAARRWGTMWSADGREVDRRTG